MSTFTITTLSGDKERVSLPKPHYTAAARGQQDFTGVWITGLYSGPRTGRRFAETYSIWENQRGGCAGTSVRELDDSEYLDYCRRAGTEPVGVVATAA
jgi:hypothetical protein